MIATVRTDSENPDFRQLVSRLDHYLASIDGDEHAFYAKLNKTDLMREVIVAYEDKIPVGCGAIRTYSSEAMEVKRMYVLPEKRGMGIASVVLAALEEWAKELGFKKTVLETGKRQPEAIALYTNRGYTVTPNYGQYAGVENSVCFEKML
ncbi:MAG: GNAT family N-acetyltransferase [Bacteroidetes bacterium]|nr:GNAT family N-acetyltransferase [Bacteroidota bacterium]